MKDARKRYRCKCPICSKEFWACKSICQAAWGVLDAGIGSCPDCRTIHKLTFDTQTEEFIATPWEGFKKEKGDSCSDK